MCYEVKHNLGKSIRRRTQTPAVFPATTAMASPGTAAAVSRSLPTYGGRDSQLSVFWCFGLCRIRGYYGCSQPGAGFQLGTYVWFGDVSAGFRLHCIPD